jgi:hypothetical protein
MWAAMMSNQPTVFLVPIIIVLIYFNWYAGIWAKYLMSDLLKGELNLIKQRSEL